MDQWLFFAGGVPFLILGIAHGIYSLHDARVPRRIVPRDAGLIDAMKASTLRLTKETTVWRAWIGFNLSHSLGLIVFGLLAVYLAVWHPSALQDMAALRFGALIVALAYVALARAYWFTTPLMGSAAGALAFAASAAAYQWG